MINRTVNIQYTYAIEKIILQHYLFEQLGKNFILLSFPIKNSSSRVQDNDDLAPLFNQYNDILKQTYGDFFVAELIESQDENNKALVAEVIRISYEKFN
jgi:hypothetical protein